MTATDTPTPEQVGAESAGRRLDAWVAWLVIGSHDQRIVRLAEEGELELREYEEWGKKRSFYYGPPLYSTDIAAAWQIVLWLRERWGQFELSAGLEWHCLPSSNPTPPHWGSGETPELAVCRAALLAVLEGGG